MSRKKPSDTAFTGATRGPQLATLVGPDWKLEDWLNFKRLCVETLLLEPNPTGRLLGWRRTSEFKSLAEARKALSSHPVFCWIAKHVPRAIATAGDSTDFVKLRRLRVVADSLVFGSGAPLKPIRQGRQRETAANAAERVLMSLNSGVLRLQNLAREQFFEELLKEAIRALRSTQRKPHTHKFFWLRWLAIELMEQTGAADPKLILEVGAALGLTCDERTAQNYAKEAERKKSEK